MRPEDQQQAISPAPGTAGTVREQDKVMLVLSYLGILALIPLLTVKDSELVKWHAKNGLVLGVGGGIAVSIAAAILSAIPVLGYLACLLWPALFVIDIVAMLKGLKGERWRIPVVSDLADKL
ncbi:MAG: DUF4870 domain-containing protein [Myxococcota bacterium]